MGALLTRIGRRARCPRWTAGLLLWAYAWASLSGGLHLALEVHSVCSHGELTHSEQVCATDDGALAERPGDGPRAAEAPERERGDVHEHCEWIGRACGEHAVADASWDRAAARAGVPVAEPDAERARSSVPLLALAPRHGPPRRV